MIFLNRRTFQGFCAFTIQRWWRDIVTQTTNNNKPQEIIQEEISAIKIVKKGRSESEISREDAAKKIQNCWRKHIVSFIPLKIFIKYRKKCNTRGSFFRIFL